MEFLDLLQMFLQKREYLRIQYDKKILWIKEEASSFSLIEIVPEPLRGQTVTPLKEREEEMAEIEKRLILKLGKAGRRLTLLIHRGSLREDEAAAIEDYPDLWILDPYRGCLYLYEKQIPDFDGLKVPLEDLVSAYQETKQEEGQKELRRMFTPVNTAFVAANVAVFLVLTFLGNVEDPVFMEAHGAMSYPQIVDHGEYYRLFTSTFLHFGADHLLQNMLILLLIGCRLERMVGHLKYAIIYLGAGLCASASSLIFTLMPHPQTVSAGASGAIFGVMGGLLFEIVYSALSKRRRGIQEIGLAGILFMVSGALSYGFFDTGIDNWAHLGGLIGGFLITGILVLLPQLIRKL